MAIPQAQILRSKELNSREKELPPLGIIIYNKGNNYDILLGKKSSKTSKSRRTWSTQARLAEVLGVRKHTGGSGGGGGGGGGRNS